MSGIRDRITELRRVRAGDLHASPKNWRTHPESQVAALRGTLAEIGYADAVLCRVLEDGSLEIIDGHARKELDPNQVIPCLVTDLSEAEAAKLLLTLDPLAAMAEADTKALARLMEEVDTTDAALQAMIDGLAKEYGIGVDETPATETTPPVDQAAELQKKWKTAPGQLWEIRGRAGTHRLMCGDSTKPDQVKTLLAGRKPFLMVTDPPYGVEYDAKWRTAAGLQDRGAHGQVTNDNRAAWSSAYALSGATVAYVWHAALYADVVIQGLEAAGFQRRSQIIWWKTRFAIGRGDYHWGHEPCWYAVRKGVSADYRGGRKQATNWGEIIDSFSPKDPALYATLVDAQTVYAFPADATTVWQIKHDKQCEGGHSTQKPVECMARPIRNHGGKGDNVYDPFLGTGTTIVAAEQVGRECYGFEISPGYTAVILQRVRDAGMTPELKASSA
jgi:DNA modification methylase